MTNRSIIFFLMIALVCSCNVRKHIPEKAYLYNGAKVNVKKTADNHASARTLRKELKKISAPRKNKMIFGFPYKVAIWYGVGIPHKQSGFRYWLRNRLGEPPVLSPTVDLEANEANMTAYLENKGFFKSSVVSSKKTRGYKMSVTYDALVPRPYTIDTVKWVLDTNAILSKDILTNRRRPSGRRRSARLAPKPYLKTGDQFDLANVVAERNRVDLNLKRKGYYYFSPDYIKSYVDSTAGDHQLNIFLTIKKDIPVEATLPQRINAIVLFPNYSLLRPPPDTSRRGMILYDRIYIRDTINKLKPAALVRQVTYRPDTLYNLNQHNQTLNRFMNMGVFKFVKSRYENAGDTVHPHLLNVYYYFTIMKKRTLSAELGGFTKSNSFTGAQANINWKNRNVFHGAEQLNIKAYGAFELSINDSLSKNNNWRLGGEASLLVPRFVLPFKMKENNFFPPVTKFTIGYEWLRRQLLYTKNFFKLEYTFSWKESRNREHTLTPVSIIYNNATAFSDTYLQQVNKFRALQYANLPEIISGSTYSFTYNSLNPRANDVYSFIFTADVAGNVLGLLNKPDSAFSKKISSAYFAQYGKFGLDLRYARKLGTDLYWANRLNIGFGIPYGNSAYLPFSRQFIIGGDNSLRGFRPRQVGPGRVLTTAEQQVTYPQIGGDYKLEVQTEIRFPIVSTFRGAVFADAGNIWTKNDLLYGAEGKMSNNFLNDLAVDAGIGVRYDLQFLIIRLDVGVPLRKPWLPKGSEWTMDVNPRNYVYNISIGYPF